MGRQINFFLHTEDQANFDKLLRTWENLVFIKYKSFNGELSLLQDSIFRNGEENRICIARKEDIKAINLVYIESQNYWLVDSLRCPVIEFNRSFCSGNTINRGRLYFQPKYVLNMNWIEKSQDFVNWSDSIIKTVRRKLKKYKHQMGPYTYTEYLGENALKWVKENNAEIQGAGEKLAIEEK